MLWIAVVGCLLIGWYLWTQSRMRRREPDLQFAAKGYMQVAITRRHAPHIDLHKVERGYAGELLAEGCTREQALSARWGGAYAIADDVRTFDDALIAYKETRAEFGMGKFEAKEAAENAYLASALLVMAAAHTADPAEYGRFLRFINA